MRDSAARSRWLGEAYVGPGRLDERRDVRARLRPLDPHGADALGAAIAKAARAGVPRGR